MFLLKLSLLTCGFYLGGVALVYGALIGSTQIFGSFSMVLGRSTWAVLFGLLWLASFLLAWRIVIRYPAMHFTH